MLCSILTYTLFTINVYAQSEYTPIVLPGYCSQYGICAGTLNEQYQNCINNTVAVPSTFDASEICGERYTLGKPMCCSEAQYHQLRDNLQRVDSILGRCSACKMNFYLFICEYTCSSNQAMYNTIVDYSISPSTGKRVMNHTESTLSIAYAEQLYHSCSNVQFGTTGKTVMNQLFHSQNYNEFFTFLGTEDPVQSSPIQIDYIFIDTTADTNNHNVLTTDELPVIPCNTTDTRYQCSCSDCNDVCPVRPTIQTDTTDMKFTIYGSYITPYTLVGCISILLYLVLLTYYYIDRHARFIIQISTYIVMLINVAFCTAIGTITPFTSVSTASHPELYHILSSDMSISFILIYIVLLVGQLILLVYNYIRIWRAATQHHIVTHTTSNPRSMSTSELYNGDDSSELGSINGSTILQRPHRVWSVLSYITATYPYRIILCAVVFVSISSLGIMKLVVETNPIKLWVPPNSVLGEQKQQFDHTFGEFYRIQQLFVSIPPHSTQELLSVDTVIQVHNIQQQLQSINITIDNYDRNNTNTTESHVITFNDLCYKPIPGKGCLIESVTEYFTSTDSPGPPRLTHKLSDQHMIDWLSQCTSNPTYSPCRGIAGAPLYPYVVFGGYNDDTDVIQSNKYMNSTAFVVTYLLNHIDGVELYEQQWINTIQSIMNDLNHTLHISYSTERSIQDEILRSQNQDVDIVVLSYIAMFIYISVALGRFDITSYNTLLVHTRFSVGLCAIIIVISSLCSAVGIVALLGIPSSPIISEVIPFLVLAIGIDNVFILLNTYTSQPSHLSPQQKLYHTLHEVGLSITLASISESFAFILGGATRMPAVRGFAFYAAAAIFIDYCLQITVFLAILVLDDRRVSEGRIDCLPCIRLTKHRDNINKSDMSRPLLTSNNNHHSHTNEFNTVTPSTGTTYRYMTEYHIPLITNSITQLFVLIVSVVLFICCTTYSIQNIKLGLDQNVVLPNDSYLQSYFNDLNQYLRVGPPLYFIVDTPAAEQNNHENPQSSLYSDQLSRIDWSDPVQQNLVCSVSGCNDNSLGSIILESSYDTTSTIANGVTNWLDDYLSWLASRGKCCRINTQSKYCAAGDTSSDCKLCIADHEFITNTTRPTAHDFTKYLHMFIYESQCSIDCGLCGYAHVSNVKLSDDNTTVVSSRYMTYHTQLHNQQSYIDSLQHAQSITTDIQQQTGLSIYPYSIFYIYFEQYLYIESVATLIVSLAISGIFILCMILLDNLVTSIIVCSVVCMITGNLLYCMQLAGIEFNAVSVVNYVMSIGISVEFCIHIATRFQYGHVNQSNQQRIIHALSTVGVSVINGITCTKLVGIAVLGLASSQVFVIYYYRMYLCIVLINIIYGLIVLPTLLTQFGPPVYDNNKSYISNLFTFK